MAKLDFYFFIRRFLFVVLLIFCCLVFFLTMKSKYKIEREKSLQRHVNIIHNDVSDAQTQSICETALPTNEPMKNDYTRVIDVSHGYVDISKAANKMQKAQDTHIIGNKSSIKPPVKVSEIKSTHNIAEDESEHSQCSGGSRDEYNHRKIKNNIIPPQNEYFSACESTGANTTGTVSEPIEQPRTLQKDDIFLSSSLPHEYSMECTEQDLLEIEQQNSFPITSNDESLINIICLASLNLKRFREFLKSVNNLGNDDLINGFNQLANGFNANSEYDIRPSCFKAVMKEILQVVSLTHSWNYQDLTVCYFFFVSRFFAVDHIDAALVNDYFYYEAFPSTNTGRSFSNLAVFFESKFENHDIQNVSKATGPYKLKYTGKLTKAPKIFIFKPKSGNILCECRPFKELIIGKETYYPKSFILKTNNSEDPTYFTCFLKNDNATWVVLDGNGCKQKSSQHRQIFYETEAYAMLYENLN